MSKSVFTLVFLLLLSILIPTTLPAQDTVAPVKLMSQREAAVKTHDELWTAGGGRATLEQIEAGVEKARQAEIAAIKAGHPELVVSQDLEDCQKAMEKPVADAAVAAVKAHDLSIATAKASDAAVINAEKRRLAEMRTKYHCPSTVQLGTSEMCVYAIWGGPSTRTTTPSVVNNWSTTGTT